MRATLCNQLMVLGLIAIALYPGNARQPEGISSSSLSKTKAYSSLAKTASGQAPSTSHVDADVLSKIYQDISRREYNVSYDGITKAWQSPNRAQNIKTCYSPGHWKLQNRTESAAHNWKLDIATLGVYADGQPLATASATPAVKTADNEITFAHPAFTEQYINTPEGVRQNFIISQAPAGAKTVEVKLQVSGMDVAPQTDNAVVLSGNGQQLTYSGLKAWDADGKAVKAALQTDHQTIALVAYTEGARFPVTIDPIVANGNPTNANATLTTTQAGAQLGYSVSNAGDVNGDGYGDVIVGAYSYDNGAAADAGAAFVYHGSATGVSTTPAATLTTTQAGAYLGFSVSGAGNVNGDAYGDVIVGAPLYDNGAVTNAGAAFVYHGSATGVSTTPAATLTTTQAGAFLGYSVSGAGNVNGDAYGDVIVGAALYDNGAATDAGAAFVYHGSATGVSTTPATTLTTTQGSAFLGSSVSGAGNVNGDAYGDVIVGAYLYDNGATAIDAGAAFVYHGSATGVSTTPATTLTTTQAGAQLGYSVSDAGNVNGDAYGDVIVGANLYENLAAQGDEGAAFVYHGSATGVSTTPAAMIESNQPGANLGSGVSGAGDVNGDGLSDVIVGAYLYDNGAVTNAGAAFVYMSVTPLPVTLLNFTATPVDKTRVQLDWQTISQISNDYFTVERSKDAQSWEEVTIVKGTDNSSALLSYRAVDNQPYSGNSYYRLKQTGYDGMPTYSAVRTVNLSGTGPQLQVYPNPARSTVTITAAESELAHLHIFNGFGQNVMNLVQLKVTSGNQVEADISGLAAGVYYLKTTTATVKLHKQ